MAHVLAVSHPAKGGTGKSAFTIHVGGALARHLATGHSPAPALVGDFDYGSSITAGLGVEEDFAGPTIADVVLGRRPIEDVIRETTVPGLHLLPATAEMEDLEAEVGRRPDSMFARHLARIQGRYQAKRSSGWGSKTSTRTT